MGNGRGLCDVRTRYFSIADSCIVRVVHSPRRARRCIALGFSGSAQRLYSD
jgi:hypothetical protein